MLRISIKIWQYIRRFDFSIIIIQYLVTTAMIAPNQTFQVYEASEVDESLQEFIEEESYPILEQGLQNLPQMERFLSTEYSIFKQNELALNQVCYVRNKMDIEAMNNAMLAYFCYAQENSDELQLYSNNRGQISSQFVVNLKNIPMYSIVYVTIRETQGNRLNMILRNAKGECLAFFWKQLKCKKIKKLLKILARIRKPVMAVILDQTHQTNASIPQIEKISNVADEFLYIFENAQHMTLKIETNDLRSQAFVASKQKCCIQRSQSQVRIYSTRMLDFSQGQIVNFLIDTCKTLQQQQISALQIARGHRSEQRRNLPLDFIFLNVLRVWKCSPKQVIVIISNLLMKHQQIFNKKEQIQIQKQRDRFLNKSADSHFPQIMQQSKPCKRCEIDKKITKKKLKKINIRCQGCSVKFHTDIPLCIQCFGDFHQNIQRYYPFLRQSKLKRRMRVGRTLSKKINQIHVQGIQQQQAVKCKQGEVKQSIHEKSGEMGCDGCSPEVAQMTKRLDNLHEQSLKCVRILKQHKRYDILRLFYSTNLSRSMQTMKKLQNKHPELNTGLTNFSNTLTQQIQRLNEYNKQQQQNKRDEKVDEK